MVVRSRAPLRVSFAGGGTDVPPFPESEGGLVPQRDDRPLRLRHACAARGPPDRRSQSLDLDAVARFALDDDPPSTASLDLVKAAIRKLAGRQPLGFDLFLHSSAPPGSGLGSSSAMMVALVGLLARAPAAAADRLRDRRARLHRSSARTSASRGGRQDQYAATFGGFNFIEFCGDARDRQPAAHRRDVGQRARATTCCSATPAAPAPSDHIIDDQTARYEAGELDALDGLRTQKELAVEMKDALLRGRPDRVRRPARPRPGSRRSGCRRRSRNRFIDEALRGGDARPARIGGKVTGRRRRRLHALLLRATTGSTGWPRR